MNNQSSCVISDHMGGFGINLRCNVLDNLVGINKRKLQVYTEYILDESVKNQYPNLDIRFDVGTFLARNDFESLHSYNIHPEVKFNNFLCTFNGSDHVGRKLLVAILKKFDWFDPVTCSKNFGFCWDELDGHLKDYLDPMQHRFYQSFFTQTEDCNFFDSVYSFGYERYDHGRNIYNLEHKLTQSFVNLVSESLATSYYPFVTEKFLYSVITRGLYLAYAQPGWHEHLQKYFGFKKYDKIFNYQFDQIANPVQRLIELMSMLAKFSVLSLDEWRDLYMIESDTIEYNYDHYFSKNYMKYFSNLGCLYYDGSF